LLYNSYYYKRAPLTSIGRGRSASATWGRRCRQDKTPP
jgi:hypothetical protein